MGIGYSVVINTAIKGRIEEFNAANPNKVTRFVEEIKLICKKYGLKYKTSSRGRLK